MLRVPSAAERAGDLSGLGVNIFDPADAAPAGPRTQFAGNIIPANRLSAQAQNLLKQIPLPNIDARRATSPTTSVRHVKFNDDVVNTRWDHYTSGKLHIFGRYSLADFRMDSPGIFGVVVAGAASTQVAPFAGASRFAQPLHRGRFRLCRQSDAPDRLPLRLVPLPRVRRSGQRQRQPGEGCRHSRPERRRLQLGNAGVLLNGYGRGNTGNQFNFGYALGVNGCNCPLIQDESQFQFVNNWTKIQGNHTFKFGADIRRAHEPAHPERPAPRRRTAVQRGADAGTDRRRLRRWRRS